MSDLPTLPDHPANSVPPATQDHQATTLDIMGAQANDMWDTAKVMTGAMDMKDYRPMGHLKDTLSK